MPTARKNSPSRMPRNGSMSASSWWRKVDSTAAPRRGTRPSPSTGRRAASPAPRPAPRAGPPRSSPRARRSGPAAGTTDRAASGPAITRPPTQPRPMPTACQRPGRPLGPPGRRQEGDQRQQRHDQQVFEQQDRDDLLATRRGHVTALAQQLHDDGRRGQHEARAGDETTPQTESREPCPPRSAARAQTTTCGRAEAEDLARAGSTAATAASPGR